jgi:hypothetical protein
VPRKKSGDDETPRRRGAAAEQARGLLLRILLHRPKDMAAGLIAFAAIGAIITNVLFLQRGPHPAPMFGAVVSPPTNLVVPNPLPRPRPAEADAMSLEPKATEPKLSESKLFDPRPVEPSPAEQTVVDPRAPDPLANLVKATTSAEQPANVPRPPAPIPGPIAGFRRVAAVQRALTEYGYGQLKQTGMVGADTKAAIEKFERERKLPVTGQVSERLIRELAAIIGRPIE